MKFFCWLLLSDRLNSKEMMKRRNFKIAGDDYSCSTCARGVEEDTQHLFITCPFSKLCWNSIGFKWSILDSIPDLLVQAKEDWVKPMFMETFIIAAWSIWKERNNLCFNGISPNLDSWRSRVKNDFGLLVHRTKDNLHPHINSFVAEL